MPDGSFGWWVGNEDWDEILHPLQASLRGEGVKNCPKWCYVIYEQPLKVRMRFEPWTLGAPVYHGNCFTMVLPHCSILELEIYFFQNGK